MFPQIVRTMWTCILLKRISANAFGHAHWFETVHLSKKGLFSSIRVVSQAEEARLEGTCQRKYSYSNRKILFWTITNAFKLENNKKKSNDHVLTSLVISLHSTHQTHSADTMTFLCSLITCIGIVLYYASDKLIWWAPLQQ